MQWSSKALLALNGLTAVVLLLLTASPSPGVPGGLGRAHDGALREGAPRSSAAPLAVVSTAPQAVKVAPVPTPTVQDTRRLIALALGDAPAERKAYLNLAALRAGELGEGLLACLDAQVGAQLNETRARLGVDFRDALDRVAVRDELAVASGRFAGAHFVSEGGAAAVPRRRGAHGTIWSHADDDAETIGIWNDEILVVGNNRQKVEAALDRLEAPPVKAATADPEAWRGGEIGGTVPAEELFEPLPWDSELRQTLRTALQGAAVSAEYHLANVGGGLQISVVVRAVEERAGGASRASEGRQPGGLSIGAPLVADRLADVAETLTSAVEALQNAGVGATGMNLPAVLIGAVVKNVRIQRRPDAVTLDVDVPAEVLKAALNACVAAAAPPTAGP